MDRRPQILAALARRADQTAEDLAQVLGTTPEALRLAIAALLTTGEITQVGMGRWSRELRLTDLGRGRG